MFEAFRCQNSSWLKNLVVYILYMFLPSIPQKTHLIWLRVVGFHRCVFVSPRGLSVILTMSLKGVSFVTKARSLSSPWKSSQPSPVTFVNLHLQSSFCGGRFAKSFSPWKPSESWTLRGASATLSASECTSQTRRSNGGDEGCKSVCFFFKAPSYPVTQKKKGHSYGVNHLI